jgi:exopolyphosphatase/guanosine-5'-triphosphate,3'-diphosphate pyrophosphatase
MDNYITTIDLGSNSFRVLQFDCKTKKEINQFETAVGLADGLKQTGKISNEAVQRVLNAVQNSIKKIGYDPSKAIAVTTQAMRTADNAEQVIDIIYTKTSVLFKIISAQKEAELTLLAMKHALKREKIDADNFLLLDIGGGSTELIIYQNKKEIIKSFPYGIVTLAQSSNRDEEFIKFETTLNDFIGDENMVDFTFVSTAGTPTTLAALKCGLNYQTYDKYIINGTTLDLNEVTLIQSELNRLDKEHLIKKVGSGRDDFIDTGINIFKLFYKVLQKNSSIVFDDGLREGVAIEFCQK